LVWKYMRAFGESASFYNRGRKKGTGRAVLIYAGPEIAETGTTELGVQKQSVLSLKAALISVD